MSNGPWKLTGKYIDEIKDLEIVIGDSPDYVYSNFSAAVTDTLDFRLLSPVMVAVHPGVDIVNERDEVIANYSMDTGYTAFYAETGIDYAYIKENWKFSPKLKQRIRRYLKIRPVSLSTAQKNDFDAIFSVCYFTGFKNVIPEFVFPVHQGNKSSLFDKVMARESPNNTEVSNAVRGTATMLNLPVA